MSYRSIPPARLRRVKVQAAIFHPYKIWPGHPLECLTCGHHSSNWRHWAKRCSVCQHWRLRLPYHNPVDSFYPHGRHCKACERWIRYGS